MSTSPRANQPRYMLLAQQLTADIARGKFPLGGHLPTEMMLREQYGVSRHTIREAIRQLQAMGLVTTRQGVGTTVVSTTPVNNQGRFISSFQSIEKMIQFGEETRLEVTGIEEVIADAELAEELGCNPGTGFLAIEALRLSHREDTGDARPMLWLKAYVALAYAGIRDKVSGHHGTIGSLIEQEYGIVIREVRQEVTPVVLDARMADVLRIAADSPALRVHRTYLSARGEIVEHAISIQTRGLSTVVTFEG